MSLSQPSGLSAAQKRKLKQNEPTMDDVTGIPEAVATEADLSTMIEELASTDSGKGASCIGYEGGTTVQAQVAANTASLAALGGGGSTGFDAETTTVGGKLELYEGTDNGTNKVTMAAPNSLAANRAITVPDADVTLADIATNTASIAAATTDTGGGAGNVGKLVELDGDGKLDGRDIGADGTKLDNIEELADVTDATNVAAAGAAMAADLASTANALGASLIGIEDASALITATTVEGALEELATATAKTALLERETGALGALVQLYESTAGGVNKVTMQAPATLAADRTITVPDADVDLTDLRAVAATTIGVLRQIKAAIPGGTQTAVQVTLPAGTWEVTYVLGVMRGAGTSGDTCKVHKTGSATGDITDTMIISALADNAIFGPASLNDLYNTIDTSVDELRVTKGDGDSNPVDLYINLRKVA